MLSPISLYRSTKVLVAFLPDRVVWMVDIAHQWPKASYTLSQSRSLTAQLLVVVEQWRKCAEIKATQCDRLLQSFIVSDTLHHVWMHTRKPCATIDVASASVLRLRGATPLGGVFGACDFSKRFVVMFCGVAYFWRHLSFGRCTQRWSEPKSQKVQRC